MNPVKDKIAFLINPESGSSTSKKQSLELQKFLRITFPKAYFPAESSQEMREIAHHLVKKNYNAIVACGGDGTLNLVSSELAGTKTALAIIPLGSGNGFARHHHIPLKWDKAIQVIKNPKIVLIDTGLINGIHFLNIAGVGFAAKISHAFKGNSQRGLKGYAGVVMKNLKLEPFNASLSNENSTWAGDTWMVEFCNGSQWGNNFRLQPGALDNDGSLNAVVFRQMNPLHIPVLGFRFATNSVQGSSKVYSFSGAHFSLEFSGLKPLHVDGEPVAFIEDKAVVSVLPKNLHLWTF